MGFDKILADLGGKPVLSRSLEAFEQCPDVRHTALVCPAGREAEFQEIARQCVKVRTIVAGGDRRQASVLAGAKALEALGTRGEDFVAVHDAARPLVSVAGISACFESAILAGAAALASRVADTLHRSDAQGHSLAVISRENLWRAETPQTMPLRLLLEALERGDATDEVSALLACGTHARLVESRTPNFKITTPADLAQARAILEVTA